MSDNLTRLVSVHRPKELQEFFSRIQHGQTQFKDKIIIQEFIDQLERMRPVGVNGKHGKRHTANCGCEDKGPSWTWRKDYYDPKTQSVHT